MKPIILNAFGQKAIFITLVLFLSSTVPLLAQTVGDYEISWSTIDGGGGQSTVGDYALVGTIGQPDAGEMAGDGSTDVGLSDVRELAYWWLAGCPPDWPWE